MKISPAKFLRGTLAMPGDKSVSHRAVMLASIAEGDTHITNFSPGEDCASTIRCMQQLGVVIDRSGENVVVHGVGKGGLKKPDAPLDCGNSGTTMRLLAGILAGQPFRSVLTGDDSLRMRPMNRIIDPLVQMGATVESSNGFAPLMISGGKLRGLSYQTPVPSAQIKSCVLLAGLFAEGETMVTESTKTRDHTERMLRTFGVEVPENGDSTSVSSRSVLNAVDIQVPGDISSAAFFLVAAACLDGSELNLTDVGVNPTRSSIIDVLKGLGANVAVETAPESATEPVATITVRGGLEESRSGNVLRGPTIAKMIDELPILAILGTQLEGGLGVRDAAELRVKESDRISAIVDNLKRMQAVVTEYEDGFKVERSVLKGTAIDDRGDHRIAMAFAVGGLMADGETELLDHECANISYPGFFDRLNEVAVR